mmetsp:Transcript_7124/g.12163  ORF Transcript_7124/g.12163 Transcript_7124/m.12163 type:complete len:250 (-) Transcript_7124:198-947(-)
MGAVHEILLDSAEQQQQQRLLDVVVAGDGWRQRVRQQLHHVLLLGDGADVEEVLVGHRFLQDLLCKVLHVVRQQNRPEEAIGVTGAFAHEGFEDTDHLYAVARLAGVDEVRVEDDVDRARQLARGGFLGHLLDRDRLVVCVCRQPVLRLQEVAVLILGGVNGGGGYAGDGGGVAIFAGGELLCTRAKMDALGHFRANQRTSGYDAFDTNEGVEKSRGQASRSHVVTTEAAVESYMELKARVSFQKTRAD